MMDCKVFKYSKIGQSSFRITKELINSIYEKARTVKKKGELVLTIPCDDKYNYVLNCKITKVKK
jgi:hypothetical protein